MHRGPQRDLVGEIADAVRAEGLRFGVYYSGGLDWSVTDFPPHTTSAEVRELRPKDAAYNAYAFHHVRTWCGATRPACCGTTSSGPTAGKRGGPGSLHALFEHYYRAVPDGVVNDRWGDTHRDFGTSEYEYHRDAESSGPWENCRGIGFSFGYNQVEDESQSLDGNGLARHLTDVVSRGGRLLLNVGPTADGTIPPVQRRALRGARPLDGGGRRRCCGPPARSTRRLPAVRRAVGPLAEHAGASRRAWSTPRHGPARGVGPGSGPHRDAGAERLGRGPQ